MRRLYLGISIFCFTVAVAIFSVCMAVEVCEDAVDMGMVVGDAEKVTLHNKVCGNASLTVIAPVVALAPGFTVERGGELTVINQPCPGCVADREE